MNKPLVSVIIPIYKVEQYLDQCIDSIVHQSYENLEIILVDDGSPDNCPKICDQWAQRDARIKVYHKPNEGVSEARNTGIQISTGEYICFVDSDDWAEPMMVECLIRACMEDNTLIAVCGRYDHFEEKNECQISKCPTIDETVDSLSFTSRMLLGINCDSSAHSKIYHKSIWKAVSFPKGRIYEDVAVMYQIVLSVPCVSTVKQPLYNYRIRRGSIVQSDFSEKLFDYPYNTRKMLADVKSNYPELYEEACWSHTKALIRVLDKLSRTEREIYKRYRTEFGELQKELNTLENVWKRSAMFSRKEKIYNSIYASRWTPRCMGALKTASRQAKRLLKSK